MVLKDIVYLEKSSKAFAHGFDCNVRIKACTSLKALHTDVTETTDKDRYFKKSFWFKKISNPAFSVFSA
ncbi:hypothetical protein GPEL0_01f5151 [Geoanaerobacter pelophilus]|uniref:Uncharacterized protein n=1 Tax=Geoanaerobacter pelophilus TaxID=60036 RepID=A0ABQ0MP04_9BACT|nr:hypothetical protein GPEL0_01f5151 [Geoanaerobacter pelophilus]